MGVYDNTIWFVDREQQDISGVEWELFIGANDGTNAPVEASSPVITMPAPVYPAPPVMFDSDCTPAFGFEYHNILNASIFQDGSRSFSSKTFEGSSQAGYPYLTKTGQTPIIRSKDLVTGLVAGERYQITGEVIIANVASTVAAIRTSGGLNESIEIWSAGDRRIKTFSHTFTVQPAQAGDSMYLNLQTIGAPGGSDGAGIGFVKLAIERL